MKKYEQSFSKLAVMLLLTINFSFLTFHCVAQAPQSFSYQAVVRDAQGNIVQNQSVAFRFSILENSATGNVVYAETQTTTTNNLGLVVLAIGNGTVLQGTFSTIQWGNASHFLKVELDVTGSTNYVDMGTTQLLSVPYALYSQNAGNVQTYTPGNGISITGNVIENTAPNQTVTITGTGSTTVTGTYPDFTINSNDNNTTYTAGNGIDVTGTTITNAAPDQTVSLNSGTGIGVTGTYPNFTINNTKPDQTVTLTGQGATAVSGTYPYFTISSTDSNTTYTAGNGISITGNIIENTAPNQPVSLTGQGATTVSGTYPDFTISSTDSNTTYTAGTGLTLIGTEFSHIAHSGDVSGTTSLTVTGIQGKPVSTTTPVANQVLKFDGTNWSPTHLIPQITTVERDAITTPIPNSLLIFNTTTNCFEAYYAAGSTWVAFGCIGCQLPGAFSASAASNVTATSFSANWTSSAGATTYYLDVSTSSAFTSYVTGYQNLNTGNVTTYAVSGLTCGTTYYYRVRANNSCGTSANSNTVTQATSACGASCGTQVWASANVNVGTRINGISEQSNDGQIEKYCYNDVEANCTTYGGLYQWAEAMQIDYSYNTTDYSPDYTCDPCGSSGRQGICPSGYHIPTDLEWSRYEYCIENNISPTGSTTLATFQTTVGWRGSSTAGVGPGDKMKVTSSNTPSWDGTNTSGFSALPAGCRNYSDGSFYLLGTNAYFWAATEYSAANAWYRAFSTGNAQSYRHNTNKTYGFSVRCLQD